MAVEKFSQFAIGTVPSLADVLVGLQGGLNTQWTVSQIALSLYNNGITRLRLFVTTTFYVATTGNDTTGDGSAGNPWLTILHAWNFICIDLDIAGQTVIIQCADGTYTDSITIGAGGTTTATPVGGGVINISGNAGATKNVVWNAGGLHNFSNGTPIDTIIIISNIWMLNTPATFFSVVNPSAYLNMRFNGVSFGTAGYSFIQCTAPCNISFDSFGEFTGGTLQGPPFFAQTTGSIINFNVPAPDQWTATGALDWSSSGVGFLYSSSGGNMFCAGNATFTTSGGGSYTGSKYTADLNGLINTFGLTGSNLPGSSAGTTATGGQIA